MNLILKHKVRRETLTDHWFLRGISESGKFYGEIRRESPDSNRVFLWSGELSESDSDEIQKIAIQLAREYDRPDFSQTANWLTSVTTGKIGSSSTYDRLAVIDEEGVAFPGGCHDLVGRMVQLFGNYAVEKYFKPIGD